MCVTLQKHLHVDMYGRCGDPDPCHREEACMLRLKHGYKFYLAFENSLCKEYITEKFWYALTYGMVPIAMGATMGDYEKLAPPNSFLHVSNFSSPEVLAKFIHFLHTNSTAYNYYHKWRSDYVLVPDQPPAWCSICKMAHNEKVGPKQYKISEYWSREKLCKDTSNFRKKKP